MNAKSYESFTNSFLVKQFDNVIINITRSNEEVVAITGYNLNQEIIDIPDNLLQQVKNDITDSNN